MTPQGSGPVDYATWDAAYVLGALSANDRREFEAHLGDCPMCRESVAAISGIPALLAHLDADEIAAITAGDTGETPDLLPSLLAAVRSRRHRTRLATWAAGAVAAVVAAIGVLVGVSGVAGISGPAQSPPGASTIAATQPMVQVGTTALASTVSVTGQRWGTVIDLNCVCLAPISAPRDTLALVVVRRDGSRTRLATWVAEPGHTASPSGSTATPVDQIASVQVVSAGDEQVLLERTL